MISHDGSNNTISNIEGDPSGGGMSTGAIVGIIVGITFLLLALMGMWYQSSKNGKNNKTPSTAQLSTGTAEMNNRGGRMDAEIMVDRDRDDVKKNERRL